jgi:hypothetical protein
VDRYTNAYEPKFAVNVKRTDSINFEVGVWLNGLNAVLI